MVSFSGFGLDMLWNGLCFLADISSWYELFVSCDDYIGDCVGFLMYIVGGDVVSKFLVNPVSIVSPVCFVKVDKSLLLMGFFFSTIKVEVCIGR